MESPEPIPIPADALSPEALQGVVASFVLREGTDYGPADFSFDDKVAQVMAQIARGEACVWFDPESSSVTIALRDQRPAG